ncbi:MAG TPA: DUF934 domain-containing protein [Polyangiaceae bacterium]|nr:DUF934 domain-containing protein [Polyangiaceae bacterium]
MRVIKDRQIVDDDWTLLAADAALPERGDVIVSLTQWNAYAASSAAAPSERSGRIGVVLHSDELPEQIASIERLPLIAIDFPKFVDGRGYTSARLLRTRFGFKGELRAVGDVLHDQLFYMARCGIDSFALKAGKDIEGALKAFDDFSVAYQAAADDQRPLFRRVAR